LLKKEGYATIHIGKWHLGGLRTVDFKQRNRARGPREHGFDHYLTLREEQPFRRKIMKKKQMYRKGGTCLLRDDKLIGPEDPYYNKYLTDINGDETIHHINTCHENKQPFFINLWWNVPHVPLEPAPEPHWSQTAAEGISDDQHCFRSMVARLDYQVGRVLDQLDKLGIADNTLIVFTSDNGGAAEANNGKLKGGKTDLHEGGIRVPFIARWPKKIAAGTTSGELGHTNDILPTICSAVGVPLPQDHTFDGVDLLPHLLDRKQHVERGTVFWQMHLYRNLQRHYPKPKPYATEIARRGKWKMLAFEAKPVELFDIEADIYEKQNLLEREPELVESLRKELVAWLAEPRQRFEHIK